MRCTAAVDSEHVEAKLQRRTDSGWTDVPDSVDVRDIKPVVAEKQYVIMSSRTTRCVDGIYRTAARGNGVLKGVPSGSIAWQYSGENAIDNC